MEADSAAETGASRAVSENPLAFAEDEDISYARVPRAAGVSRPRVPDRGQPVAPPPAYSQRAQSKASLPVGLAVIAALVAIPGLAAMALGVVLFFKSPGNTLSLFPVLLGATFAVPGVFAFFRAPWAVGVLQVLVGMGFTGCVVGSIGILVSAGGLEPGVLVFRLVVTGTFAVIYAVAFKYLSSPAVADYVKR